MLRGNLLFPVSTVGAAVRLNIPSQCISRRSVNTTLRSRLNSSSQSLNVTRFKISNNLHKMNLALQFQRLLTRTYITAGSELVKPYDHRYSATLKSRCSFSTTTGDQSESKNWNDDSHSTHGSKSVPFTDNRCNTEEVESHGQPIHQFGSGHELEQAAMRFDVQNSKKQVSDYKPDRAAAHHVDVYNHMPSVSLSACMQSQVPQPYGKSPSHMNMPGGGNRREDKYIQGRLSDVSDKREFSTFAVKFSSHKVLVDEHGNPTYSSALNRMLNDPCPQGIQGEDCEEFKLWFANCLHYGDLSACEQMANDYIAGRKTLAELFMEYDIQIRHAGRKSKQVGSGHTVMFAGPGSGDAPPPSAGGSASPPPEADGKKPTAKSARVARLKAAVRDYGSLVVVFHVGISLMSLGFFYTLVASNVDVVSILNYFNITLGSAQSSVETASTFAAAYAVHKIFAPVRIGITLTCVPLVVRSLRARGILKAPPRPPTS